ncbi:Rpn family recombination-promoting nuclease/putative transposase [Treponema sp. HNW]|uniref:Rpn family recombination-promoting nuclease/putative transposase n=1 Tax=Treponema sp. HNW TaxID=3116654 RepID=UPI003D0BA84A
MRKSFDDLTIADDYMFYRVMENTDICKTLLNIVLHDKTDTITDVQLQKTVADAGNAKGVRFDVWAKDCNGTIYDVEMQAINKDDLARRIRYYQSAIDVSVLEKNQPYESLPDSFIIFFCTFDYIGKDLPVYSFKTICTEDSTIHLADGITKIIINSTAAEKEASPALKSFLQYMNGKISDDGFIRKIEQRIKEVKESEELRKEYMLINSFERDARNDGWKSGWQDGMQAGMQAGIAQGKSEGIAQGFADGSRQTKIETAKLMKQANCELDFIIQISGLSKTEIEKL